MLQIRSTQYEELTERAFVQRIVDKVSLRLPEILARKGEDQIRNSIGEAMDRARSYGITSCKALMQFSLLWILAGPQLEQSVEFKRFLEEPSLNGDEKMRILLNRMVKAEKAPL